MGVAVPISPSALSASLALVAAVSWGGGDFAGGMGVKAAGGSTTGALRVIAAAHAISLFALLILLSLCHAAWPSGVPALWGLAGGVAAGLSLTAFYIALSRGAMGASAAVSGLLAAAIPAGVSVWIEGAPSALRLLGFVFAAVAIWLIAAAPDTSSPAEDAGNSRTTTVLAIAGGVGFGLYFVAMRFANPLGLLEPLALARTGSLGTCLLLLVILPRPSARETRARPRVWLSARGWLWAVGVAVLDTGGNLLFLASTRLGRLDVAAVLVSLYPASTILLAAWLLRERPSRWQYAGMGVAALAVLLITV